MISSSNAEIPAPVRSFAQIAEEFCALIDAREQYTTDELLGHVHVLLPRLYSVALALPDTRPDHSHPAGEGVEEKDDEPYDMDAAVAESGKDRIGHERLLAMSRSLGALIGDRDCYAEIFDPYAEPAEEAVTGMLSDDLADIYADLTDGLAKWRRGEHDQANWAWRFSFGTHWGEHATGALRALYTLAARYEPGFPRLDGGPL
jgi:hypothetical protein